MEDKYSISIYTTLFKRDQVTIVCNTGWGTFLKLPTECWKNIEKYIAVYSPKEICDAAQSEDKDYYKKIFSLLIEKKILTKEKETIDTIDVSLTNRCNLQCMHCAASAKKVSEKEDLTTTQWKTIMDKVILAQPNLIVLTGGEPLVRTDFEEIVSYIRTKYNKKMELMTNGLLINGENVRKIIKWFDAISISIDGFNEESCAAIRGKGVFQKVLNTVELLIDNGFKRERLSLSLVETEQNYQQIDQFISLCDRYGVKSVVRRFAPVGRGYDNREKLQVDENVFQKNELHRLSQNKNRDASNKLICRSCRAGKGKFYINYCGDIYPCQSLDTKEYCIGNILKGDNISLTTNSYRKTSLYNKCKNCDVEPFCRFCLAMEKCAETPLEYNCMQRKNIISKIVWGE